MKIIEVGTKYFRRGAENALQTYTVRVAGCQYEIVATSRRGAEMQAEMQHEREMGYLPGRGPRAS